MKNIGLGLCSVLFVSCAHFDEAKNVVVQFPYAADLVQKVQLSSNRAPASVKDELSQKSPRRVYFSALYYQYLTLGKHLSKKTDIKSCPQFHHDKLETDSSLLPRVSFTPSTDVDSEGKDFFPELAFNEDFSLRDYHKTVKAEIETLCEDGESDNYYKFDNLVTHYSTKQSFHQDTKAMASVLKIPVFANFYLVKMLEIPGLKFTSPEEKRFADRRLI